MPNGDFKLSGYLEPEEVHAIINAVPEVSHHAERDQLLIELLWQTGARVSEAITLVPERIGMTSVVLHNLKQRKSLIGTDGKAVRDAKGKIVKVKNDNALKEVEVSEALCQKLKAFCTKHSILPGEWIFKGNMNPIKRLSRWYVWYMLTNVSEQAQVFKFGKRNIKTGGRFKGAYPHTLRHSAAMHLLEETGNISLVQQQLGHASVTTTQGYAFIKQTNIKKAIKEVRW